MKADFSSEARQQGSGNPQPQAEGQRPQDNQETPPNSPGGDSPPVSPISPNAAGSGRDSPVSPVEPNAAGGGGRRQPALGGHGAGGSKFKEDLVRYSLALLRLLLRELSGLDRGAPTCSSYP